MPGLLVNIDVPDLAAAVDFYTRALGLMVGRRLQGNIIELLGAPAPIYLLEKAEGSAIGPVAADTRHFDRHWSPVHLDFVTDDLDAGIARAVAAGAAQEGETVESAFGRLAMFADPFGHGFCLIQFSADGYDAIRA